MAKIYRIVEYWYDGDDPYANTWIETTLARSIDGQYMLPNGSVITAFVVPKDLAAVIDSMFEEQLGRAGSVSWKPSPDKPWRCEDHQ